jgi:hypothetical protein
MTGGSLRERICEEQLKKERAALLRTVFSKDEIWAGYAQNYTHWPTWKRGKEVALLKARSTHIHWAACSELAEKELEHIEARLIQTLNPIANRDRPDPSPNTENYTEEVLHVFRLSIHEHRNDRFRVSLA